MYAQRLEIVFDRTGLNLYAAVLELNGDFSRLERWALDESVGAFR